MIKPGTVCMIRGVPKDSVGYPANGRIVSIVQYIGDFKEHQAVHEFDPPVVIEGQMYNKCKQQWLHPLDPCEDDLTRETLERLEEEKRTAYTNYCAVTDLTRYGY